MFLKLLFLVLCASRLNVESARILGMFDFPSKSHHILGSSLLKALAGRGHQVTMVSPFPLKSPVKNYEDIELKGVLEFKDENIMSSLLKELNEDMSFWEKSTQVGKHMEIFSILNRMVLNQTVETLLKPGRKFDLVIQNWFFNTAYLGIAHHFQAPVIAFSGSGSSIFTNKITANSNPSSYVPNAMSGFTSEMSFFQRFLNTAIDFFFAISISFIGDSLQEQIYCEYFPNAPPLEQLEKNISLVLLNSHLSIESPRPYVPSLIQVGGFHLEEPKELTGELKEFMNGAKEGVLYFSLGSNIKSADLPKTKLEAIINTFAKLPVKVLWKFESDTLPKLPSNVKVGKWLPQTDILAHPNLKAFVTHGGLLSTTEAVYHGAPVVGIPFFADQSNNIAICINKGFAVEVPYKDLSEKVLTEAINEVLNNPRYLQKAKELSHIFRDQPIKPKQSAVFWVEYVLRHKGAHHLKTSALKLTWYQYYLLDVFALLSGIILIFVLGTYLILRKLWKVVFRRGSKNNQKQNKSGRKSKKE